jgi:hypothetical protein
MRKKVPINSHKRVVVLYHSSGSTKMIRLRNTLLNLRKFVYNLRYGSGSTNMLWLRSNDRIYKKLFAIYFFFVYNWRYGSGSNKMLRLRSNDGFYKSYFPIFGSILIQLRLHIKWYGSRTYSWELDKNYLANFGLIPHSEQGCSDENCSDKSIIRTFFVFGAILFGEQSIWR